MISRTLYLPILVMLFRLILDSVLFFKTNTRRPIIRGFLENEHTRYMLGGLGYGRI